MPLVSVFMKSYNHDRFISEAIESILSQDFDDFELIIVDDASTDESRKIIRSYAEDDSRIRLIFHEHNLGITETVNDGINAAQGKFIAQIDSDDVWVKHKLQKQLDALKSNENLLVWSEGELIDQEGQSMGRSFSQLCNSVSKKKSGYIFEDLLPGNYIFGSSLLYKKANLGNLRYDESLAYNNDYKFILEMARRYDFYYIAEPLAQYRIHGRNALLGFDAEAPARRRRAYREEIAIRQDAMHRYDDAISNTTKAEVYANMRFVYEKLGDNKAGVLCFLRAIWYNPFSRSNLLGTPRFLQCVFLNLLNKRTRAQTGRKNT